MLESDLDDPLYIDEHAKSFTRTLAGIHGMHPELGAATTANALTIIGTVGPAAAGEAAAAGAAGEAGVEDPASARSKITIKMMKTKDTKKELTGRGLNIHGQRADLIKSA